MKRFNFKTNNILALLALILSVYALYFFAMAIPYISTPNFEKIEVSNNRDAVSKVKIENINVMAFLLLKCNLLNAKIISPKLHQ